MKFPYAMLLDFVRTELNADEIGDLLTMAGFELEGIESVEGDDVLDIKVVSNRGDGLSVFGLSREVLAKDPNATPTDLYRAAASRFSSDRLEGDFEVGAEIGQIEHEGCNRLGCRIYRDVPGAAVAPEWIQLRLRQAGMRPLSLLVDLTNYVMLEMGQPLHAYDQSKLAGAGLVVKASRPGEKITTLNGLEHELSGQMMICDHERPVGVPGVMGGLDTEVTETTQDILLEAAHFTNIVVRKTRKQLGLNTEASYRFERSVDPDGVVAAIQRFTQLLQESIPTARVSNVVDHYPRPFHRDAVRLRPDRASRLLGMEISLDQANDYLSRLGMSVSQDGSELKVTPPSWRPDIVREEDLVEELGRVHGYERIPERPPFGNSSRGGSHGFYARMDRLRDAALRSGFREIVSHALRDFHPLDLGSESRIGPRVPASPDTSILRDSLLPSLADAAVRNGGRDLHLFEMGRVFRRGETGYDERTQIALLSTGALVSFDRKGATSPSADFFSAKGVVQQILAAVGAEVTIDPNFADPRFHPSRQGRLVVEGQSIGALGQIHPDIAASLKLSESTFLATIDVDVVLQVAQGEPKPKPLSRNPVVRRDITVAIDLAVPFAQIAERANEAGGEVIEKLWLVDLYVGPGVPEGQHALTLGLQMRKMGENFTDEEANQVRDSIVAALEPLGATMR